MARTSRGLPGFLRRTIRSDYDVDDQEVGGSRRGRKGVSNGTKNGEPLSPSSGSSSPANRSLSNNTIADTSQPIVPPIPIVATTPNQTTITSPADSTVTGNRSAIGDDGGSSRSIPTASETNTVPTRTKEVTIVTEELERTSIVEDTNSQQQQQRQLSGQEVQDTDEDGVDPTESNRSVSESNYYVPSVIRTGLERTKSYKEVQFEKTMNADIINVADLRRIAWNGIPPYHRSQAWKFMLGYLPANSARRMDTLQRKRSEYNTAIQQHYDVPDDSRSHQEQETLRQVLVDVPRTQPNIPLFRNERIRKLLSRLLYIWAMRHPASSYVQGINDLATPFVAVFLSDYYNGQDVLDGNVMLHVSQEKLDQIEADCYWCLTNLLAGIQDHYTSDQPGVQRMVLRLEELVNRIDSNLCQHLRDMGIEFMQFAFKWMNCLLLREFNLRCVIRLWDTYISEKDNYAFEDFHVYVCAAFLCQFSNELQEMDFDELFAFMQEMPTDDWGDTEIEMLLSQAFVLSTLFGGSDAHLTSGNKHK